MRAVALAAALLAANPAVAGETPAKPSADAQPLVRIDGDTLTYIGGINDAGLKALSEAVSAVPRGQVTKMVVNSGGGDTRAGIHIGAIVADLKPHLTIETGCFSSCANFIAPAAASITIRENAFLGWHGNDRGFLIAAAQKGLTLREYLKAKVGGQLKDGKDADGKPVDLEGFLDEAVPTLEGLIVLEAALYKRLGLADTFAVCGTRFDDRLTGARLGWGFSTADMARLGLPPVRYEGPGAYEDNPAFQHWLFLLTPEDCTP
jgi:hypothetical protein